MKSFIAGQSQASYTGWPSAVFELSWSTLYRRVMVPTLVTTGREIISSHPWCVIGIDWAHFCA